MSYTQQPSQHGHGCARLICLQTSHHMPRQLERVSLPHELAHEGVRAKQLLVLLPQVRQRRALKQHVPLVTVRRLAQRAEPLRAGHAPQPPVTLGRAWQPVLNRRK